MESADREPHGGHGDAVLTAITDRLSARDRQRLANRLDELRDLDALMRQPGTLASPAADKSERRPPHDS